MNLPLDGGTLLIYGYLFCMLILFLFSAHNFVMIYYFIRYADKKPPKKRPLLGLSENQYPSVTIQLPIFNEYYVAERLIEAACALDWPKHKLEVQVLDDSTDETLSVTKSAVERFSKLGFDISLVHRSDRKGFKAGALREALNSTHGEYVAIFDADFLPHARFLKDTIPYFAENIGMVQTRWGHLNEGYSILTKSQAIGLNGHFVIQQTARNNAGFFINFNGTAGIWKKDCIVDAGNWQDDTLTEDLDLSYRAQLRGWQFIYLNDVVSPGELPIEINALKSQQYRWTKGSIETAKKMIPEILKSNFSAWKKIQALFHLTSNFAYPLVLLSCILNSCLLFVHNEDGRFNMVLNLMTFFALTMVGILIFYMYAEKAINADWKKKLLVFPVFMMGSIGLSISNTKAVLEGLFNVKSKFIRTPKWGVLSEKETLAGRIAKYHIRLDRSIFLEVFMVIFAAIASGVGLHNLITEKSNFIGMFLFNLWALSGFSMIVFLSFQRKLQPNMSA